MPARHPRRSPAISLPLAMDRNTLETLLDHLTSGIVLTMLIALALLAAISMLWVTLGDRLG